MKNERCTSIIPWIVSIIVLAMIALFSFLIYKNIKRAADNTDTTDKHITVALMDKGRCPAEEGDMSNNRWTKFIKENSGIDVEFIPIERNNFEENLNLLIASGTIPDVMLTYEATYVEQMISQGLIQPLDKLFEEKSTVCKEYLNANPELKKCLTFNGELYAMSNLNSTIEDQGLWIRQDWLDQLGLAIPTTEEEFLNVCRAFKEAKLGGEDTVALALPRYYWAYFAPLYNACDDWYINGDTLEYGVLTDRFAKSVALLKTCYDEGLISREFMTDTDGTLAMSQWNTGKAGIILYKADTLTIEDLLIANPEANPVPMVPFTTSEGENGLYQSQYQSSYIMVSSKAKNPIAVIKYLDWLLDEGWKTLEWGIEGQNYAIDEAGQHVMFTTDESQAQMKYISAYNLLSQRVNDDASILAAAGDDEFALRLANLKIDSRAKNISRKFRRDLNRTPNVSEYGTLYGDWTAIQESLLVRGITGGTEYTLDDMHADIINEWNSLGGEEVTRLVNEWYQTEK